MERAEWSLVGREDEIERISSAIRADRPIAIVGEPGIGKTSLVRTTAAALPIRLHEGGGFATLIAKPMLALSRAIGTTVTGDVARAAATVEQRVGPDLLFIDDLQWVDRQSLAALELLIGRVGLVTAIRDSDSGAATAFVERLGFELITLSGLDLEAARRIIARVAPGLGVATAERVVAKAAGNPLLLEEMAAHGDPSPVLARAMEAGLDRLSPEGRRLVELLAIADRPVARDRLGELIDEPLRFGIVLERDGRIEVRHAMLAEIIRARLDDASRAALHERAASLVDDPIEAARHLAAAGSTDAAVSMAHTALETEDDPIDRATLLSILAEAEPGNRSESRLGAARALGDISDWNSVIRILSPSDGAWAPEARAERAALVAHALFAEGRHAEARDLLVQARGYPVDPSGSVSARVAAEVAAFMINVDGQVLPALEYLDAQILRHLPGDPSTHALRSMRESVRMLAVMDVDLDYLRSAIDAALAARGFAWAADLTRVLGFATLIWEGAQPALDLLGDMGARFDAVGVRSVALEFLADRVQAAVSVGSLVEAMRLADELLEQPAAPRAHQTATIFRARALGLMGRLDEATGSLIQLEPTVSEDFLGRGELLAAQADLALWGGTPERAIALAGSVRTIAAPIHGAYGLSGITRAWAQFEAGLSPEPVTDIAATRIMAGAAPELEGLRLLHVGDPVAAADRFAEAAALWAGFNMARHLTCAWAEGEAFRQAGRHEAMVQRLAATMETATTHGFVILATRVRRAMRRGGMRVPTVSAQRGGGITLTARERELVSMVEHGLTNIEIARRMGLGRPTVARILSNAMNKLGAESRAQLIVLAAHR